MDFEEVEWIIDKVEAVNYRNLTDWEIGFIESIKEFIEHSNKGFVSDKQADTLERIRSKCV